MLCAHPVKPVRELCDTYPRNRTTRSAGDARMSFSQNRARTQPLAEKSLVWSAKCGERGLADCE